MFAGATTVMGTAGFSVVVRNVCNVDNMGSSMSAPGCSGSMFIGSTPAVTRGAGVSVEARSVCNVDNMGSSMSLPGAVVIDGTGVNDCVFVVARRVCNVDNIGSSMSLPGTTVGAVVIAGTGGVSFAVKRVCNADNIGTSMSAPGFTCVTFVGATIVSGTTG
jgi:hypothetical protein